MSSAIGSIRNHFLQNGKISYIQGSLYIETNRHQQVVEVPRSGMTLDDFRAVGLFGELPATRTYHLRQRKADY